MIDQLRAAARGVEIAWRSLEPGSPLIGQTLVEANLRARTGASVVALVRDHQLQANPKSSLVFAAGDLVGLIGDADQITAAERILVPPAHPSGASAMLKGLRSQPSCSVPSQVYAE
jgi:CPA2 family monovalent cation:H+ antiporter-2